MFIYGPKRRVARQTTESFRRETCAINERLVPPLIPNLRTSPVGRLESVSGRLVRLWGRRGSLESFATTATARYRFNRATTRVAVTSESLLDGARRKLYKFVATASQPDRYNAARIAGVRSRNANK